MSVARVYAILSIQLLFTAGTIHAFHLNPGVRNWMMFHPAGRKVPLLGLLISTITWWITLGSENIRQSPLKWPLLLAFTAGESLAVGFISSMYAYSTVIKAMVTTALSTFSITIYTLMQKNPKYKNVLLDIYDFFEKGIKKIDNKKIIIDPGIGFGKNLKHNLTLISKISLFHSLGFPILIGTSRKRFISQISGVNDSKERIGGTIASVLFLLSQGVQIFRVHNVNEVKQGILVFRKILSNFKN